MRLENRPKLLFQLSQRWVDGASPTPTSWGSELLPQGCSPFFRKALVSGKDSVTCLRFPCGNPVFHVAKACWHGAFRDFL